MITVKKTGDYESLDLSDLEGAENVTKEVLLGHGEGVETFVMRRFTIAGAGHTPYHKHDWEHEVFILSGEGQLKTEDGLREVEKGDAVYVPPNELHQFLSGDAGLTFLCLVPNRGDLD